MTAAPSPNRSTITSALGIVQILTWGSTFYLLAVLAEPIAADTGWSREVITGGVSIGLLVSGLTARHVGRMIAANGGQRVLLGGITLLILGLVLLSAARTLVVYYAAWIILGMGMAASLYEAAFSTLGVIFGNQARGAITRLTLWGGFASTVCWPLSALLVDTFGWRGACIAYALLHLCVTAPLCWYFLPRNGSPASPMTSPAAQSTPRLSDPKFQLLALTGITLAMTFSIISVHLVSLLTRTGLTLAVAVGLGALIGPAQVGARVIELLGRERHHPVITLIVAASCVCIGIAALRFNLPAAAALIIYGAGTGLFSIARGTVPLALFGADEYPVIMGQLAFPILLASAIAPLLGAYLIETSGAQTTLSVLVGLAAIPLICAVALARIRHDPGNS